jgi:hypothetical protein
MRPGLRWLEAFGVVVLEAAAESNDEDDWAGRNEHH